MHWGTKLALLATAICYAEMLYHNIQSGIMAEILDTKPFWDKEKMVSTFETLGPKGREAYGKMYTGLFFGDLAFPLLYSASLMGMLLGNGSKLWFLPMFVCTADVLEGLTVSKLLQQYNSNSVDESLVFVGGSVFTPLKWFFLILTFIAIVFSHHGGTASAGVNTKKKKSI